MNYGELKAEVRGYLQRASMPNSELDDLQERARNRIADDLRGLDNITEADVSCTSGTGTLPTGFREIVSVRDSSNRYLRSAQPAHFYAYGDTGSQPAVYLVDDQLRIAPRVTATVTVTYFKAFDLMVSDSATVPLQDVYLSAMLADGFLRFHNMEMATYHDQKYAQQIGRRNRAWRMRQSVRRNAPVYNSTQRGL